MSHLPALIWVWELISCALLYSVFCRLVRTDQTTRLDVRISIFVLGLASLIGLGAPIYGWEPDGVVLVLASSMVLMQWVAARHWTNGVPESFVNSKYLRTGGRRNSDKPEGLSL